MPKAEPRPLAGVNVLVTRPEPQARGLCALIEAAGGLPVRFPVLEILPSAKTREAAELFQRMDRIDWLIFVSANAVRHAMQLLADKPLTERVRVAAIGQATAIALAAAGIRIDLVPKQQFNSEALLAMPEIGNLDGQTIVIVRGEGGRELLGEVLSARGAKVFYAEVYRRALPTANVAALLARWHQGGIQTVTITSGEALVNLAFLLGEKGTNLLQTTPLVVISPRLEEMALALGCRQVTVAQGASDDAVLEAVQRIARKR